MQSYLEQAFGKHDVTSAKMRGALREWLDLYYGAPRSGEDPAPRLAALIVAKLCRTVFAEYDTRLDGGADDLTRGSLTALNAVARLAMQYALMGGECLLKPVLAGGALDFVPIRRDCYVPLARDAHGNLLAVGTMECTAGAPPATPCWNAGWPGRTASPSRRGSLSSTARPWAAACRWPPWTPAPTWCPSSSCPACRGWGWPCCAPRWPTVWTAPRRREHLRPGGGTAPRRGPLRGTAQPGIRQRASRVFASEDLLRPDLHGRRALQDDLFVGLPDDPSNLGVTVYSPALREESYLARKQDLLRGCESLIGLRRGILSETEAEAEPRTATEITATSVDYDLTIRDLQAVWETAAREALTICQALGGLYGLRAADAAPVILTIDWGDGVLYDRSRVWEEQRQMVADGLLRPELALAWYYGLPHETEADLRRIRDRFMPKGGTL